MKPKNLSPVEQFAYVFTLSRYIETLKEINRFDQREKNKILDLLKRLKSKGIFIENLEPIYAQLGNVPAENQQATNDQNTDS